MTATYTAVFEVDHLGVILGRGQHTTEVINFGSRDDGTAVRSLQKIGRTLTRQYSAGNCKPRIELGSLAIQDGNRVNLEPYRSELGPFLRNI